MPLNMKALTEANAELEKKSGSGSKNWIQWNKATEPFDFKVMDPLPAMNGIYYIEVPHWWINKIKVISPRIFGPNEFDPIKAAIDEAKASKDPTLLKLLNQKSATGQALIQYKTEYWIAGLKFNWKLSKDNSTIEGIYDAQGNYDVNLIKNYIEDQRWKILVTTITGLKSINKIATARGGHLMVDPTQGFNLNLQKTGKDKDTVYSAVKMDNMPMPLELYSPDLMVDPFEVAQAQMFTTEYMDKIIGKYLYNEECPEKTDSDYMFPEIREQLKNKFKEEDEDAPAAAPVRTRPGATPAMRTPAPALAPVPEAPAPDPTAAPAPQRRGSTAAPAPSTPAENTATPPPTRGSRTVYPGGQVVDTPASPAAAFEAATDTPASNAAAASRPRPTGARPAPGRAAAAAPSRAPQRNLSEDLNNVD